jgi:integrase
MSKRGRGHGEGTIVRRSDGRWMGQIDLGYIDGKRKRKTVYGKTRKEVAEKLNVLLTQHGQGYNIAPERQTVAQFLERWLQDVVEPSTRPRTYRVYAQHVRGHIIPRIGHIQLTKLTAQHVQSMLNTELKAGLSPVWVERTRDVLRNALNQAVKWEFVSRNAAALANPPKVEQRTPRILTPTEVQRLLAAAQNDRLEALYRVALTLGLR